MPEVGQNYEFEFMSEKVGEVQSISLSIDSPQINVNNFDVAQISAYIKGRSDVTLSITCHYTRGQDDGHAALIAESLKQNAAAEDFTFAPKTPVSGDIVFAGKGRPSSVEITAEDDEAVEISFDFQVSDTFTATATT